MSDVGQDAPVAGAAPVAMYMSEKAATATPEVPKAVAAKADVERMLPLAGIPFEARQGDSIAAGASFC